MTRRRRSRRSSGRRCAVDGCQRRVQAGRGLCASHARSGDGPALEAAIGRVARRIEQAFRDDAEGEAPERAMVRQEAALASFRHRLERGEYGELFVGRLREVMAQAAVERGLADEIGGLRVVMVRLLTDPELDASAQARGMAQVVGTILRAVRVQRELGSWGDAPERDEVRRVLVALAMAQPADQLLTATGTHAKREVGDIGPGHETGGTLRLGGGS